MREMLKSQYYFQFLRGFYLSLTTRCVPLYPIFQFLRGFYGGHLQHGQVYDPVPFQFLRGFYYIRKALKEAKNESSFNSFGDSTLLMLLWCCGSFSTFNSFGDSTAERSSLGEVYGDHFQFLRGFYMIRWKFIQAEVFPFNSFGDSTSRR